MRLTHDTISHTLTLDETLARLAASPQVDGLALFGSRPSGNADPVSDYDLLVQVDALPSRIFQLFTDIDGRMADVVVVERETADRVLADVSPVAVTSFEGMFLLKMQRAQIVYDGSGRLRRVQEEVASDEALAARLQPPTYAARYAAWFWQNHIALHLQRIARSDDPVYATAFDLMMAAAMGDIGRVYMTAHSATWQGPKDFVRYVEARDAGFLALLAACLNETDRAREAALYAALVQQALAPIGEAWTPGVAAVFLADPSRQETQTAEALSFWEGLLESNGERV